MRKESRKNSTPSQIPSNNHAEPKEIAAAIRPGRKGARLRQDSSLGVALSNGSVKETEIGWKADLSKLFENAADGVWVSGSEGQILFWNRAAENILGYRAQEVGGRYCRDIFDGCDGNGNQLCRWPCPIKSRLQVGEMVQHFDMKTQAKTGRPLWVNVSCISLPAHDSDTPIAVHLFRDVTVAHEIDTLVRQKLAESRLADSDETLTPAGELTKRELQIVSLMRDGASTAAIAKQLFVSRATVKNHIQNIFSKLNVHSRLEAVAYVNRISRRNSTNGDAR